MIRYAMHPAVAIVTIGWIMASTESFCLKRQSTRRLPHRDIFYDWKNQSKSRSFVSYVNGRFSSRLFSLSDFSSHPYSVYYGTSGSTARQNFDQNDNINDVYGYGSNDGGIDEPFNPAENRRVRSMQDDARLSGRRGATVFGRKYDGGRDGLAYSKEQYFDDHSRMMEESRDFFHDDSPYMDSPQVMHHLDDLLYEREHLRRNLDAVIRENMNLHRHQNRIGNHEYGTSDATPPEQAATTGKDHSANGVVDDIMMELKTMQETLISLQNGQETLPEYDDTYLTSDSIHPVIENSAGTPNIDNVMNRLRSMQEALESFKDNSGSTPAADAEVTPRTAQNVQSFQNDIDHDGRTSTENENVTDEIKSSHVASIGAEDAARMLSGEYVVVINAELRKKSDIQGRGYNYYEETMYNDDESEGGESSVKGESFGSKYL